MVFLWRGRRTFPLSFPLHVVKSHRLFQAFSGLYHPDLLPPDLSGSCSYWKATTKCHHLQAPMGAQIPPAAPSAVQLSIWGLPIQHQKKRRKRFLGSGFQKCKAGCCKEKRNIFSLFLCQMGVMGHPSIRVQAMLKDGQRLQNPHHTPFLEQVKQKP